MDPYFNFERFLINIFEQDYSLLLFYSIFILIELRILILLCKRISLTEYSLFMLQEDCIEMKNKLLKYDYIDNKTEIRNLRSRSISKF